jgi:hypothetical protein
MATKPQVDSDCVTEEIARTPARPKQHRGEMDSDFISSKIDKLPLPMLLVVGVSVAGAGVLAFFLMK